LDSLSHHGAANTGLRNRSAGVAKVVMGRQVHRTSYSIAIGLCRQRAKHYFYSKKLFTRP
jgi:hypothetical protein